MKIPFVRHFTPTVSLLCPRFIHLVQKRSRQTEWELTLGFEMQNVILSKFVSLSLRVCPNTL